MNLLIQICPKEIEFFDSIGITVINCDSDFRNQKKGHGTHYLWVSPEFEPKYEYWGGGEDNPMTGFSLGNFKITENYLVPNSAFFFSPGESHFGCETVRRQVVTDNVSPFAPNGTDGLTPTRISWDEMLDINEKYHEWVASMLTPGLSRTEHAKNPPSGWPKGPFYDPICAVARCAPSYFHFMKTA